MAELDEDTFGEGSLVSPSRMRSSVTSKEAASRLFRDISPTKVFTASTSGGGSKSRATTLPDLFKQKNALASLRPAYLVPGEAEEQDTRGAPRLLARCDCVRISAHTETRLVPHGRLVMSCMPRPCTDART